MRSHFTRAGLSLVLAGVVVLASALAFGQGIVTGSISGAVQDPQGALVSGAAITATHIETNRQFHGVTNESGQFLMRQMPPGSYNVTVTATGFQTLEVKGLQIAVGQDSSLGTVKVQLGKTEETLTIEGSAPLVEAQSVQIQDTFTTKQTAELPIGNTYDSLALFVPGVATAGDASFSNNNGAEFAVNGQRARSNNFQLDGQNNNDNSIGGPSIFFGNQDVISELQVITNYTAEYGRNLGSVVNYVTKSGTNSFHGTGFEFWQGNTFASLANEEKSPDFGFCLPTQDPATFGCERPVMPRFVQNQFGGTLGGPILKDKLWFFGSGNFVRQRTGGAPLASSPSVTPTANGLAQLQAAFPGNAGVASLSQIGPLAVTAGNPTFSNLATRTVTDGTNTADVEFGEITRNLPSVFNDYEGTGRVDFQLTNKDRFFGRYIFQQSVTTNFPFEGSAAGAGGDFVNVPGRSQQIGLDYTHTFSNTLLNQLRFSFSRSRIGFEGGAFPNCVQSNLSACPTQVFLDAPDDLGYGVNAGFPQGRTINVYQLQNNASWLKGKHAMKFGGEYSKQRSPNVFLPTVNGFYEFDDFNALLANTPNFVSIAAGDAHIPFREHDLAFYFQDDFRVKSNLTLNLGLRWEWFQQAINNLHDATTARQTGPNPIWDPALPLDRTAVPSVPNAMHNFGPVIGFAWTPNFFQSVFGQGQTVIRGGFRIAYDPEFYNMFLNVANSAPAVNLFNFVSGTIPGLPTTGALAPDVQGSLLPQVPQSDPGLSFQTRVSSNFHNPYSEQWNFGIQRQFGTRAAAEVRYVGNHTVGNFQNTNGNIALQPLIDAGFGNLIPAGLTPCADATQPGFGYADCARSNGNTYTNDAYSIYHGLQSQVRIQNWHGLTAQASYTFSKTIDNASEVFSTAAGGNTNSFAQNPFDLQRGERGLAGIDFPHVFGILWIYEVPFGKTQQGLLGHVLGGWQLNSTYRYSVGQPYTVVQRRQAGSLCDPTNWTGSSRDACRPIVSNPAASFTSVGFCADPTAPDCGISDFVTGNPTTMSAVRWILNDQNAATFFGSPFLGVGRNTERGDPISTINLGVFKNTKIRERLTVQFQAEAFNLFNTQFRGVPNPRITSVTTGAFGSTAFNPNGGATFAGNLVTDGIARRRLQFGLKLIF
jgi:hypothetical protein